MYKLKFIFITLLLFCSCAVTKENQKNENLELLKTPEYLKNHQWNSLLNYFSNRKIISKDLNQYIQNVYYKLYPNEYKFKTIDLYFINESNSSLDYLSLFYFEKGGLININQLNRIKGEHELAALIAFGKERSKVNSYQKRIEEEIQTDNTNCERIVHFFNEENREAIGNTIDVLFHAGYDLRSLLSVLSRVPETPDHKIEQLKEMTQRKIFNYPPLVNPLLRTNQYYQFQKEIESL